MYARLCVCVHVCVCVRALLPVCVRSRACVHVMVLLEADGQSKQTFDEIETRVMDCGRAGYEERGREGQTGAGQVMKRQAGRGRLGQGRL